jgi:hypothetical protein
MAVVLLLGISFFTFTKIGFLVDTYRGKVRETNPIHYLLFVTYFPHLIAGPVMHHAEMMPQFAKLDIYRPRMRASNMRKAIGCEHHPIRRLLAGRMRFQPADARSRSLSSRCATGPVAGESK